MEHPPVSGVVGQAARLDAEDAAFEQCQNIVGVQTEYVRFLVALTDLLEGRGCVAVEGNARTIVMTALGLKEMPKADPCDDVTLVFERLPNGEHAWLQRIAS
jgi:hypothetical protein